MIIRPVPARAGSCPRCDGPLDIAALRAAGWRFAWEGRCATCGHAYLQDLPYGHGLVYPAALDLDTGETLAPVGSDWFADALADSWREPDGAPVAVRAERRRDTRRVTLLNALDPVYGHSVLKLLNVQRELAAGDVVVLAPASLAELIPADVAEAWLVDEPASRFRGWLVELELWLREQLDRFEEVRLSPAFPHPHPSTWSLPEMVSHVEPEGFGDPSVLVVLRDDRTWGAGPDAQARNVERLAEALRRRLPGAGIVVTGVGEPAPAPPAGVTDLRDPAPDTARERRWIAAARGAAMAIGVHGSHMLIPGGLAQMSIELLPANRYDNALQATLVTDADPVLALFRNRTIPGAVDLADVSPDTVAELAVSMLKDDRRFEAFMAGAAAGVGADADPASGAPAPLPPSRPTAGDAPAPEPDPPLRPSLRRFAGRRLDERASARAEQELHRQAQSQRLPAVMTDVRGMRFELESADEVLTFLRHGGHFEADEVAVCHRWLQPGMTAVDVGANLGAFTAAFASAVGPDGAVHSLEPFDAARRRLERTLELNDLPQVQVHPLAVAEGAGTAALYSYGPGKESWATLGPRTIEAEGATVDATVAGDVPTVSLDGWAEQNGIEFIDLLKVDVEGAEGRVLAGAERLLGDGRIALALVETSDDTLESFGVRAYELLRTLEGHGLRTYVARDGRLVPFRVAGRTQGLANVFAASPRALQRLRELELAD